MLHIYICALNPFHNSLVGSNCKVRDLLVRLFTSIFHIDKASKQFSNLLHLQLPNQHHSTSRNPARNVKNPFSITIFTMWEVFGVCLTIHLATKPPPTNHEMSPSLSRVKHVSLEDPCLSKYPKFPIHLHRCFRIQRPLLLHRTQKHAAVRSSPLKNITITQHNATMQMGHTQMHPPLLSFFFSRFRWDTVQSWC